MGQEEQVGDLERSVGYLVKRTATALRTGVDAALRPLDLTVSQYSCLEVLGQRPGLSNADLARATFVTRQAVDGVLRGLRDRELVTRTEDAPRGRALPTRLTGRGRRRLEDASAAVRAVERQMLAALTPQQQDALADHLITCTDALAAPPPAPPAG